MHVFLFQLLTYLLVLPMWGQSFEERLQEAQARYLLGEKATHYQERKLAFNQALLLYHELAQTNPDSADLDQALGNTCFQLGEYAWAILYYERALKKGSQQALLRLHLTQAQEKLGLSSTAHQADKSGFFFSLSQRVNVLLAAILITFFVLSCAIWLPFSWLRKLAMLSIVLLVFLLGNALFFYYSTPVEGVLIKSTGLYRAPDWNQPQLKSQPLLAGSKVHILHMTADGEWLKIEDRGQDAGMIGYIPTDHLRPI